MTAIASLAFQNGLGRALDKKRGKVQRAKKDEMAFVSGFTTDADSHADSLRRRGKQNGAKKAMERQAKDVSSLAPEPIS